MIFAIRVNLIGTGKRRGGRRRMPDVPNIGILLFILVLVIESAVLYSWHASASEAAHQVDQHLRKARHDLEVAKKLHADIEKVNKELATLSEQVRLFDELKAEKSGPVNALSYLSFILQNRDPSSWPREEQKLMEAAGWRVEWKANRAWFTTFTQAKWIVTLKGEALAHEDVAEVQRRLESSPYFRAVKLVFQENADRPELKKRYVEFTIKAALVYQVDPWKWPPVEPPEPEQAEAVTGDPELPALPSAVKAPRDRPKAGSGADMAAESTSGVDDTPPADTMAAPAEATAASQGAAP